MISSSVSPFLVHKKRTTWSELNDRGDAHAKTVRVCMGTLNTHLVYAMPFFCASGQAPYTRRASNQPKPGQEPSPLMTCPSLSHLSACAKNAPHVPIANFKQLEPMRTLKGVLTDLQRAAHPRGADARSTPHSLQRCTPVSAKSTGAAVSYSNATSTKLMHTACGTCLQQMQAWQQNLACSAASASTGCNLSRRSFIGCHCR
jgi:hypothetical protein